MPPQLKTLLPFFAALILFFLIIRHFLIPESFGELGHYRANSIEEIGDLPIHYAGKSVCIDCHDIEAEQQRNDSHASLSCEICHGPGAKHANDYEVKLIKSGTRKDCGRCHNLHSARKIEAVVQVNIQEHHTERENCIDCHNPHAVWELKE
ncbi:hypothetical protein GM418_13190 [Maribellus comscasis]|uniref:Uncharacterized protein n=1 Tax=Maribellus comscasis TaxID=2681766 RepID=A0A6I6JZI4_9BACT|nr:hypothetical protein [Maribellus comscasis]QGY44583.1 hypothetical protein GM418_13190 [Maribellus comscasis]